MRRPAPVWNVNCSRHSGTPPAKRCWHASANWRARLCGRRRPRPAARRRAPRGRRRGCMLAARLAMRTRQSGSSEITPVDRRARITARLARSVSAACCARRWSSRARAQALGHVVERMHEEAHLVVRGQRQARVEIALRDRARALHQVLDRLHEPLRREDRAVQGRQQRQQQHQGQRQDEAGLERLAQVVDLAELLVGRLHGVGQRAESLGDRDRSLQHQALAAGPGASPIGTAVRIR